jgi:hypothetical protein
VLEVRRTGKMPYFVSFQNSLGGRGLASGNQRSDPHDRFTVLLPGHAHFRPDHMDSAFFCTQRTVCELVGCIPKPSFSDQT